MKVIKVITFLLTLCLLSSCIDELPEEGNLNYCPGVRLDDGTCPQSSSSGGSRTTTSSGWDFSNSSDYSFNSNFVEVSSGRAALKEIDTNFSESDFSSGSHVGTHSDNNKIEMIDKNHSSMNILNILSNKSSNLIGYWRFENNWADSSSYGNSLTSFGDATFSNDSKVGANSAIFDGAGDYLELDASLAPCPNDELSISFWIKGDNSAQPNSFTGIIHKGLSDNGEPGWYLDMSGTDPKIKVRTDTTAQFNRSSRSNSDILNNAYNYVVVTLNRGTSKIYVNGEIDKTDTYSAGGGVCRTSAPLRIGRNTGTSRNFAGVIDELSLWNSELSSADVKKIYDAQKNNYAELSSDWTPHWDDIIGYWKMDGNWQDSSGNGKHGSSFNDATFSTDSKIGNQAGTFDGTTDYVDVGSLDFENTTEQTILTWFKIHTLGEDHKLFSAYISGDDALEIVVGNDNRFDGRTDVSGSWVPLSIEASEIIEQDRWYHAGFTVNGNELALYLNGKKVASKTISSNSSLAVLPARIGQAKPSWMTTHDSHATIDDTAVWKKQLSESDILLIYNRQKQNYAASYQSPVIDLGSSQSLKSVSKITELPFLKEISTDSERSSDYSSLSGDLSNGLVGYWTFNEQTTDTAPDLGSGNTDFKDQSSNSNHGTITGGISVNQQGILGSAVKFDGTNSSKIDFGPVFLSIPNSYTTCGWYYVAQYSSNGSALVFGGTEGSSSRNIAVTVLSSGVIEVGFSNGAWLKSSNGLFKEGVWQHVCHSWDGTTNNLYFQGEFITSNLPGSVPNASQTILKLGNLTNNAIWSLNGLIDEFGVWNRALTASEVQELYRRGANRVKYQVRTCSDSTCSGDPEWKGPGGDGTTYFSELYNRSSADISTIFSSCDSSGDNLCSADEFSLAGATQAIPYRFDFVDSLINNYSALNARFFQYRVLMEAEENTACGGEPCLPSLTAISFETANDYYDISPSVTSTTPITISGEISKVEESVTGGCSVKYQFSKDGTNFSYYNSGSWKTAADAETQANTAGQISSTLKDFISSGSLYVRAYLTSNGSQSCELQSLSITQ